MSAQSEILGNAAPPHVFERKDAEGRLVKAYPLRLIDDSLNVEWERRQLKRAREFEAGNRDLLSRDEYMERLDRLSERYHAGEFSLFRWLVKNTETIARFKGDAATAAKELAASPEVAQNFVLLFSLVFGCDQMEMLKLLGECGPEVVSYVNLIVRESMPSGPKVQAEKNGHVPNA